MTTSSPDGVEYGLLHHCIHVILLVAHSGPGGGDNIQRKLIMLEDTLVCYPRLKDAASTVGEQLGWWQVAVGKSTQEA